MHFCFLFAFTLALGHVAWSQEGITPTNVIPDYDILHRGIEAEIQQVLTPTRNFDYRPGTPLTDYVKTFPIKFAVMLRTREMKDSHEGIQLTIELFETAESADESFVEFRDKFVNAQAVESRRVSLLLEENRLWRQHLWEGRKDMPIPDESFYCHVSRVNFFLYYRSHNIDRKRLLEMGHNYRDYLLRLLGEDPVSIEAGEIRLWTNTSGKTIEAALVSHNESAGTITLRREDGQLFPNLPISGFSRTDVEYLEKFRSGTATPAPVP